MKHRLLTRFVFIGMIILFGFSMPERTRTAVAQGTSCFPAGWSVIGYGNAQWNCQGTTILAHSTAGDSILASAGVYADVTLSATVSTSNREASLAIRLQDAANGYIIELLPSGTPWNNGVGLLRIAKRIGYVEQQIGYYQGQNLPSAGQLVQLKVSAIGTSINVELNGQNVLQATDSVFSFGAVGLRIMGDSAYPCDSTFANVVVNGTPLISTSSISGRVTDNSGTPIPNVTISDGAGHTRLTDFNGYFALAGVSAGNYAITASKNGYTFSPSSRNVSTPPNALGQNFTVTLSVGCYSLTTNSQPLGGGTVARSSAGNCNNGNGYTAGTVVRLTASPASGYRFNFWSGDVNGTSTTINVPMTGNKNVTANFGPPAKTVVLVRGFGGPVIDIMAKPDYCGLTEQVTAANLSTWVAEWGIVVSDLYNRGWDVRVAHIFAASGYTPRAEDNVACLRYQLGLIGAKDIVLIAHSYGGLVSRAYVEDSSLYDNNISQLITLGTPHTGASGGDAECLAGDPSACEFSPTGMIGFNNTYSPRRSMPYTLIGGNLTPWFFGGLLKLSDGPNDGAVGVNSAMGKKYNQGQIFQPPTITDVLTGSNITRYAVAEAHGELTANLSDQGGWHPNYWRVKSNDNTTLTQAYSCVQQVLGITSQGCPPKTNLPIVARLPNASIVSQTATLSGHLSPGQPVTRTVAIDTNGFSQFKLTWVTGAISLTLQNPLGTVIDPTYAATHPSEVVYMANTDATYQLFATYALTTTVPGMYALTMTAGSVGPGGTDYSFSALVDSPRTLTVATDRTFYSAGDTANITATLQNAGTGMAGAIVQAQLTRSDGVTATMSLSNQGGGQYLGTYAIPSAPGFLGLSVIAQGNDAGIQFSRQVDNLLAILSSKLNLAGRYADNAVDNDANGKYEALNATIGVNSIQAGIYRLSGDLVKGGTVIGHATISSTLPTGTFTATLPFNGDDVRQSGLNGPYILTNLTIVDEQSHGVPAIWNQQNLYTTAAYNLADFATNCFVLSATATPGGTVSASPPPNCNSGLQYASGTGVTLTASPGPGFNFAAWNGDASGSTNPLTIKMTDDQAVQGIFLGQNKFYLPMITK